VSRAKTINSRINYCQTQLASLKEVDLSVQAQAMGLSVNHQGQVPVTFLGRELLVTNDALWAVDGSRVSVDAQSVVAHYLQSRGRGRLSGQFVPINRLTGISVSPSSPSGNLVKPLEMIDGNYEKFTRAAVKIGGIIQGDSPSGAKSFLFGGLPYLPVKIDFFESDEEFPFEIKLLFDSTANIFASYECLELYTMCLVVDVLMAGGWISDPDDCERSFL
jgi:hypothetical protein